MAKRKMYGDDAESAMEDKMEGMEECNERAKHITAGIATVMSGSALRDEMPDGIDREAFQDRNVDKEDYVDGE